MLDDPGLRRIVLAVIISPLQELGNITRRSRLLDARGREIVDAGGMLQHRDGAMSKPEDVTVLAREVG